MGLRLNVGKFLDPFYKDCDESDEQPREDQKPNRCYKQDPMQGGHGNRDDGTYYGLFSDFQNARIQRYFEGTDATDGRAFKSPDGGYSRWNPATESFVDVQLRSTEVPRVFDKDLTAVIFTISCAELKCDALGALDTSSLEATQVYPPDAVQRRLERVRGCGQPVHARSISPRQGVEGQARRTDVLSREWMRLCGAVHLPQRRGVAGYRSGRFPDVAQTHRTRRGVAS